jgi:hypothetical protein
MIIPNDIAINREHREKHEVTHTQIIRKTSTSTKTQYFDLLSMMLLSK